MKKYHLIKFTPLILLCITTFILCFWNLSQPPLERWDEYTNYKIVGARHVLPLLLDDEAFFEKPPLWYWLTIVSSKIFGLNNFSVRIVNAVSGFLLILLVFYLGWKIFSYKAGIIAGFVLLATRHLFVINTSVFSTHTLRSADLDALQLLFIVLAFWGFLNVIRIITLKTGAGHAFPLQWIILSAIFTALGFLTKGPFSLIPALTFFMFLIFYVFKFKHLSIKTSVKLLCVFIITFVIITAPWHLYMLLEFGKDFLDDYLGYHIIKRGLTALEGHKNGTLFYIQLLFNKQFFFSGEIFLLAIIYLVTKYKEKILRNFALFSCLAASLLMLIITALIQTKLSWYIFPLYPFAALLIGKFFEEVTKSQVKWIRAVIYSAFILLLVLQVVTILIKIVQLTT